MTVSIFRALVLTGTLVILTNLSALAQEGKKPVQVKIAEEKAAHFDTVMPIDPAKHMTYQGQGGLNVVFRHDNRTMHLGTIYTMFQVDGQLQYPGNDGGEGKVFINRRGGMGNFGGTKLPKTPGGKEREGFSQEVTMGKIKVTQIVEVVPCKAEKGAKRRLDSCLVRYTVENTDDKPHKIAMRVGMDVYIATNDGALFASPTTHPGKILDGIELKGKEVPDYLQALQNPDLKNPGFVAYYTYGLGNKMERPSRVVLTSLGAGSPDGWNMQAIPANGDSAMSMYWDAKDIPAKGKREMAYGYGGGIATSPENEGNVKIEFGGSFEPGKQFSIRAFVADAAPGQTLQLVLPPGMDRLEGREIQPVPAVDEDGNTMVLWKCRVNQTGEFPVRIRSNTGVTQSKIVTITPN